MNYIRNSHVLIANLTEAFKTCMTLIILWNIKEDILKYGVIFVHIMKVSGVQCCLDHNVVQNIFFCVLKVKESHAD